MPRNSRLVGQLFPALGQATTMTLQAMEMQLLEMKIVAMKEAMVVDRREAMVVEREVCPFCEGAFKTKSSLKIHILMLHKGKFRCLI